MPPRRRQKKKEKNPHAKENDRPSNRSPRKEGPSDFPDMPIPNLNGESAQKKEKIGLNISNIFKGSDLNELKNTPQHRHLRRAAL